MLTISSVITTPFSHYVYDLLSQHLPPPRCPCPVPHASHSSRPPRPSSPPRAPELEVLSDVSKVTVLVAWLRSAQLRQDDGVMFFMPESHLFAPFVFITWATVLSLAFIWRRLHHLRETAFVVEHGYSNKWKTKVGALWYWR